MTTKADGAFRTISEVSEMLDVPAHVLRFWNPNSVRYHLSNAMADGDIIALMMLNFSSKSVICSIVTAIPSRACKSC